MSNVATDETTKTKPETFTARKSMAGKWKKVGAPPKPIVGLTSKPCRGSFTVDDLFALNGGTIAKLTIRNRIDKMVEDGEMILDNTVRPQKERRVGAPPKRYRLAKMLPAGKKPSATAIPTMTVDTAPVVNANPEEAAAEPIVAIETPEATVAETPEATAAETPEPVQDAVEMAV